LVLQYTLSLLGLFDFFFQIDPYISYFQNFRPPRRIVHKRLYNAVGSAVRRDRDPVALTCFQIIFAFLPVKSIKDRFKQIKALPKNCIICFKKARGKNIAACNYL